MTHEWIQTVTFDYEYCCTDDSQKYGCFLNKEAKNQAMCFNSQHIFF